MSEEKDKQSLENELIRSELIKVMSLIGDLWIHVNGEGKIDFADVFKRPAHAAMVQSIIAGDIGCLTPYEGYEDCALGNAIDLLYQMDPVPHLNSSAFEKYVPTIEEWKEFVDSIKKHMEDLSESSYQIKYTFELKKEGEVIATVVMKPICNAFVVGEYSAGNKYELLGEMDDYDQPMIDNVVITIDGKDITIPNNKLTYYRNRIRRFPRKGDYLLRDLKSDNYLVLPQEDYSIH